MIKAIIFDLDGVLIDSEPFWREVEVKIFAEAGIPLTEERARETMGLRVDEVVEHWLNRYPSHGISKKKLEAKILVGVIDLIKEKGAPREGVKEIMDLFDREHIPTAIASSAPTKIIDATLEKLSIREHVKVIHSAEKEPYGKPHPGVYITAAKMLKVPAEDCLVFEDSPNGVLAAKAAKMKCVAVPDPLTKADKRLCIADMVIDSLKDFRLEDLTRF